ncbi:hypothetical protein [Prevotella intermedia]|uniref:hypothetical protein n=1 Tax=Prevotella intermedia TaxID=28131 RepID=UPI004025D10F
MDRDGLSEPLGTAADVVYVAIAARLEVDAEVETVVAADALVETQGLQRGKTGVTDADGDGGLGNGHWLVVLWNKVNGTVDILRKTVAARLA